jgi:hypothetical protein
MDIVPELKNRESPLVFNEKDVEKEKIEALIEAARWAPSCFNNQPWNSAARATFLSTKMTQHGKTWRKHYLLETDGRRTILVAVGAKPDEDCDVNGLPYYAYDAGLSVMSMVVEAEHLGLRTHQMAGYDEKKLEKL